LARRQKVGNRQQCHGAQKRVSAATIDRVDTFFILIVIVAQLLPIR